MSVERLTENDVVHAMARHFEADGWSVTEMHSTFERGIDLVATRGDERLVLEAKGGTSSKATPRQGMGFSTNQQRDHVANAVLKALKLRSLEPKSRVAIAFPDTATHRHHLTAVAEALNLLAIWVYVVDKDRRVLRIL